MTKECVSNTRTLSINTHRNELGFDQSKHMHFFEDFIMIYNAHILRHECTQIIGHYNYKGNDKLVSHPLFDYTVVGIWKFYKHLKSGRSSSLSTSLVFFFKIPTCLYNSAIHSVTFTIPLVCGICAHTR